MPTIAADRMRDFSFTASEVLGSGEAAVAACYSSWSVVKTLCSTSAH